MNNLKLILMIVIFTIIPTITFSTDTAYSTAVVLEDSPRVRKAPDLQSEVLFTLKKDEEVIILQRSEEKSTIQTYNDYWYFIRVSDGKTGWSYGTFLEIDKNIYKTFLNAATCRDLDFLKQFVAVEIEYDNGYGKKERI